MERKSKCLSLNLAFSVDGLDAWLSISGIGKLEFDEGTEKASGSIRFHRPEDISLTLSSGDQLEFSFSLSFPNVAIPVTEMAVKQTSLVRVRSERPQSVECFSTIAVRLCNFLSLALDQDVGIQSMTGFWTRRQMTVKDGSTRLGYTLNSHPSLIAVHLSGGIVLYFCFQMWPTGLAT